jgi:hypothetical protein
MYYENKVIVPPNSHIMNALNLLLLRLVAEQPAMIMNSSSPDLIVQIKELCEGFTLNPVRASVEEMQSIVFIFTDVELPPFSFSDISNVWIEDDGEGRVQLRKVYKSFRVRKNLAEALLAFKDLGYWVSDCSFSVSLTKGRSDNGAYVQGIKNRIVFWNTDTRYAKLISLQEQCGHLVRAQQYEEVSDLRDDVRSLEAEIVLAYQQEFGPQGVHK